MSLQEAAAAGASAAHEETISGVGHEHPSDGKYIQIALILGVITAAEVALPYLADEGAPVVAALLAMMTAKFAIIALWFMHLRFDSRLFRRLFVSGLVLAVLVYIAVLVSFQYFGDDTTSVDERRGDPPAESAEH